MKRLLFVPVLALVFATPALAKGPSEAKITGPDIKGGAISFRSGGGDPSQGTPFGRLVEDVGFFPAMYGGMQPNPILKHQPKGALGPKYKITYRVPGPNGETDSLTQDLYPYAASGPLTYVKAGQPFFGDMETYGGWFQAPQTLKTDLVERGLPANAPSAGGSTNDGFWPLSNALTATLAAALGLGAVAAGSILLIRRRPGAAAAG
jgi:hypothetical protein